MQDYNTMQLKKYHTGSISNCSFLVTGGAGFIGSHLAAYLLAHGAGKVRVLDNFSTGSTANIAPFIQNASFELLEGDIRDADTCRRALQGIDYVLHEAALGSVPRSITDPATTNDVNITGFLNILTAAKEAGVKRMVYAASSSTYGDSKELPKVEEHIGEPLSPYAVTKYVNELYAGVFAKVYGFNTIGLRYFNVFGPGQNPAGPYAAVIPLFMKAALTNQSPKINGDGLTSRDFTFVDNVIQANIKALFKDEISGHEVFNIACGSRTTLNELWRYITDCAGINTTAVYGDERSGDVRHSLASIQKAADVLGYIPEVPVQQGLNITYQWYKMQYNAHNPV